MSDGGQRKDGVVMGTASTEWAIICGWYANAYSIVTSLRAVGWEGEIVCLKRHGLRPALIELVRPPVSVLELDSDVPEDLIDFIATRFPAEDRKVIFFTNELYHPAFAQPHLVSKLKNTEFWIGSESYLDVILDRFLFYEHIEALGAGPVPRTVVGFEDPFHSFGERFFIRPRRTWKGSQKLERVQEVGTRSDLAKVLERWRGQGLCEDDWCYQEVLSTRPKDNVSVSGWHDSKHQCYLATRHILRHPNDVGNGDVTESIPIPGELRERTERILRGLHYSGPFELEYLLDFRDGQYKPIELNPRFWMQHGLIEAMTDHEPVRRYLGMPGSGRSFAPQVPSYWVFTFYALFRLVRLQFGVLRYLMHARAVRVPSLPVSMKWAIAQVHRRTRL